MASLDSIVNVSISRQTQVASLPGFGIPGILGTAGNWPSANTNKIASYSSLAAVLTDYATSTPEYQMANAIFSQTPKPASLRIIKRTANTAQVNTLTPTAADATVFAVTIDGVQYSFTSGVGATATSIVTGLKAAIAADPTCRMTSSGTTTLILTSNTPGWASTVASTGAGVLTNVATTPNNGPVEDVSAAVIQDNSWYMLLPSSKAVNDIQALAAYIEGQKKLMIVVSNDATAPTSTLTDIAQLLKAKTYFRSSVYYSSTAAEWGNAAWAGRVLPLNPGSETWKFKTLAAITAEAALSDSGIGFLDGKNANYEIPVAGINMTAQGKTAAGEFIDIMRGIDWLQSIMQSDIFTKLTNVDKLPFTDAGIAVIEASLRAMLQQAVRVGLIGTNSDWTVTVPKVGDVLSADRAARSLTGVSFTAKLAGAIHATTISGVVTV